MKIRTGIIIATIVVIVLIIIGGFFALRSPDLNLDTDRDTNRFGAGVSVKGIEEVRQRFSDTVSGLDHLDKEHRAAQLSLFWDLYIEASGGKYNEFLVKWVEESILLIGSRYTDPNEPLDQMAMRHEGIKKRFAECLESIGMPLTPEMRAIADEQTQYGFLTAEEIVIEFLNRIKRVKIMERAYKHMYQSRPTSAIGQDFIKGVSYSLFTSDPRTEDIVVGVAFIASLRNKSNEEIKNRAMVCLDAHLKTGGLISEDDPDSLILFMPEANGAGLGCAIMAFLIEYKKTEANELVGKLAASSQSSNMANEEYLVFDRSAVFPHEIPAVDKGGIRSYPLSQ